MVVVCVCARVCVCTLICVHTPIHIFIRGNATNIAQRQMNVYKCPLSPVSTDVSHLDDFSERRFRQSPETQAIVDMKYM